MAQLFDKLLDRLLVALATYTNTAVPNQKAVFITTNDDLVATLKEDYSGIYAKLNVDPLHASAAAFLRESIPEAIESCTEDEIKFAEDMRSHFVKKFTWKSLKGQLTPWQSLALRLLTERGEVKSELMGLLIKLPQFYREDLLHERLKTTYAFRNETGPNHELELKLVEIARFWHGSKKMDHIWLTDSNNYLYCLPIDTQNSAHQCIISSIQRRAAAPFKLRATLNSSKIKELQYTLLTKYQFEE